MAKVYLKIIQISFIRIPIIFMILVVTIWIFSNHYFFKLFRNLNDSRASNNNLELFGKNNSFSLLKKDSLFNLNLQSKNEISLEFMSKKFK